MAIIKSFRVYFGSKAVAIKEYSNLAREIGKILANNKIKLTFEQATEIHVVPNFHTRKKMMFDLSDGFVVLPGGLGTL